MNGEAPTGGRVRYAMLYPPAHRADRRGPAVLACAGGPRTARQGQDTPMQTDQTEGRSAYDRLMDARGRYAHLRAIEDPDARMSATRAVVLGFVTAEHRQAADYLIGTLQTDATNQGEAFVEGELAVVARHFGDLGRAILAVWLHVKEDGKGRDGCNEECDPERRPGGRPTPAA